MKEKIEKAIERTNLDDEGSSGCVVCLGDWV